MLHHSWEQTLQKWGGGHMEVEKAGAEQCHQRLKLKDDSGSIEECWHAGKHHWLGNPHSSSQMSGIGATHCNKAEPWEGQWEPCQAWLVTRLWKGSLRGNLAWCTFRIWQCLTRDLWLWFGRPAWEGEDTNQIKALSEWPSRRLVAVESWVSYLTLPGLSSSHEKRPRELQRTPRTLLKRWCTQQTVRKEVPPCWHASGS